MKASERTWICNNRCRAMHRLKTYLPNDAAAAEEMVNVFCAECLAQTQEEDDRMIGTVNLKENAELICEILNADAEGRVWEGAEDCEDLLGKDKVVRNGRRSYRGAEQED